IENDVLVRRGDGRGLQVPDGPDDAGRLEITTGIVVLAHYQDAGMVALTLPQQLVEEFKVRVVVRQEDRLFADGSAEVLGVFGPRQAESSREEDHVAGVLEESRQQCGNTVVIQIQLHCRVRRCRSSGARSLGEGWYL